MAGTFEWHVGSAAVGSNGEVVPQQAGQAEGVRQEGTGGVLLSRVRPTDRECLRQRNSKEGIH